MKGEIKLLRSIETNKAIIGQRRFTSIDNKGLRYEKVKPFIKFKKQNF